MNDIRAKKIYISTICLFQFIKKIVSDLLINI
jgi:hypothetical protein